MSVIRALVVATVMATSKASHAGVLQEHTNGWDLQFRSEQRNATLVFSCEIEATAHALRLGTEDTRTWFFTVSTALRVDDDATFAEGKDGSFFVEGFGDSGAIAVHRGAFKWNEQSLNFNQAMGRPGRFIDIDQSDFFLIFSQTKKAAIRLNLEVQSDGGPVQRALEYRFDLEGAYDQIADMYRRCDEASIAKHSPDP